MVEPEVLILAVGLDLVYVDEARRMRRGGKKESKGQGEKRVGIEMPHRFEDQSAGRKSAKLLRKSYFAFMIMVSNSAEDTQSKPQLKVVDMFSIKRVGSDPNSTFKFFKTSKFLKNLKFNLLTCLDEAFLATAVQNKKKCRKYSLNHPPT